MFGFGEYELVEWPRPEEVAATGEPDVLPVLMRALAPFREAREAVARALREAAGLAPLEDLWSG